MKYCQELVDRICDELATGKHTIADTCKKVGISESQYYTWKQEKSEFSEAIKRAERSRLTSLKEMAMSGLAKLLNTHEYEEVTTEYENEGEKPKIVKQKRVKKIIMPNPTAVIFTLTNQESENWKNRQNIEAKGDFNHSLSFGDFLMKTGIEEEEVPDDEQ